MRYLFYLFIFFIAFESEAQNLVPNPSFEEFNPCGDVNVVCKTITTPDGIDCKSSCCAKTLRQYNNIFGRNSNVYHWWAVNLFLSPFYYNACTMKTAFFVNGKKDFYKPRTGNAHIMLNVFGHWHSDTTDYRHYAQVKLTEPLQAGCRYEVSCYALLTPNYDPVSNNGFANTVQTPADGLSMYMSADSVYMNDDTQKFEAFTSIVPQISNPSGNFLADSVHYQKVSGIYEAQGGEQWLVIGNFKDNAHTQVDGDRLVANSMYSIDDVSVTKWKPELVDAVNYDLCEGTPFTVTLPEGLSHYKWSTGDTTRQVTLLGIETYTVEASNGCEILRDTFTIHRRIPYTDPFSIGEDTFFCKVPDAFFLKAPENVYFPHYTWSTGSNDKNIEVKQPGKYWLTVDYECGELSDTILVKEFVKPDTLFLPAADTNLCSNQSLLLEVWHPEKYSTFKWSDNGTQDHLLINQPGTYSLKAITTDQCEVKDSLQLSMTYPPMLHKFDDTTICEGTSIVLTMASTSLENVLWYDGSTNNSHSFHAPGMYWVSLSNACFLQTDSFVVDFVDCSLFIPNLVTANDDKLNDFFSIETKIKRPLHLILYNAWGSEVYNNENYDNEWGGQGLNAGIYYYQIKDTLLNRNYKGWLQVIK